MAVYLENMYEGVPELWLIHNVVLIPKKKRRSLRVDEFRLVSLNEVSYYSFGAVMRQKFVEKNGWLSEKQSGFSTLYILRARKIK